jgi:zinc protease
LEESLAGRVASIALDVREEMCVIKGEAISSEMGLLFELLYTQIKDPGYRKEARELALKRYDQRQLSMMAEVEGVMQMQGQRLLAGGDSRFGLPSWDEFKSRTLEEVQTWFGEQLQHGPLEIAVVGDFDTQHAIDLAARYFGALPPRSAAANWKATPTPNFPRGARHTLTAQSAIPKALLVVAYPTDDFWDIGRTRRLNILADILTEKMRERIRERLGAVYSPFAFNRSHRAYPRFGILQVRLSIDPSQAEMLIGEVNAIAAETARGGIEADQFHRILDPTLVGIKDLRQTNNYWLNSVLTGASRHPEQLVWSQTMEQDYAAISAAEISALARHYLGFDTSAVVVVRPR